MVFIRKRHGNKLPRYIDDNEAFGVVANKTRMLRYSSPFALTFDHTDDTEKGLKYSDFKSRTTHDSVAAIEQLKRKEGLFSAGGDYSSANVWGKFDSTDLSFGNAETINPMYQYNEFADPRTHPLHPNYGRVYNETLRSNQIIAYFRVGRPDYIKLSSSLGQDKKGKELSEEFAARIAEEDIFRSSDVEFFDSMSSYGQIFATLLADKENEGKGAGQLYTFKPQFRTYAKLVSGLMTDLAARMNISGAYDMNSDAMKQGFEGENSKTKRTDLDAYIGPFAALMYKHPANDFMTGESEFIPVRIEKSSDYNEDYGNSTRSPAYASELKGLSDKAKDLLAVTHAQSEKGISGGLGDVAGGIGKIFGSHGTMTANGWNMHIPEMWDDATSSRNLSITIKLYSPYGHKQSIFEDLYVPALMFMGMALARQSGNRLYAQPPLISVFARGWFSIHAGMITSLSIKRGGDRNDWTVDRLPRSLEMRISIKDMFPTMIQALNTSTYAKIYWNNKPLNAMLDAYGGLNLVDSQAKYKKLAKRWETMASTFSQQFTMGNIKSTLTHALPNPIRVVKKTFTQVGGF